MPDAAARRSKPTSSRRFATGRSSARASTSFETEPLPADSPLWDFDNVTITPHVAAVSDAQALGAQIAEQIEAFERGEPLRNCVDRERGY